MSGEKKKFVVAVSYTAHVEAERDSEALAAAMYESVYSGNIRNLQMRVVAAIPLKQEQPAPEPPTPEVAGSEVPALFIAGEVPAEANAAVTAESPDIPF